LLAWYQPAEKASITIVNQLSCFVALADVDNEMAAHNGSSGSAALDRRQDGFMTASVVEGKG
jgi:hypothetical protein